MKKLKAAMAMLAGVSLVALAGCNSKPDSATVTTQTATVQRGNIVVSTTATGNLAFTRTEDVAFDMAGTVQEVLVKEGDSVREGQVLATLDASAWEGQLKTLEKAVRTAEGNLAGAERKIAAQELVVRQAELDLWSAENAVADIPAVKNAQHLVDNAQAALAEAHGLYAANPSVYGPQIVTIQQQLAEAKTNLQSVLAGTGFSVSGDVALQIAKAQLKLEQTARSLEDAKLAVDNARQAKDDAEQALEDTRDALQQVQALSPTVKAPFEGFVTKTSVQGGQEVKKGAVAVQIADPNKFRVGVLVGERDISSMAIGGQATVSIDAMSGLALPATITAIAPTATIQQGVVNYLVTVELQSVENQPEASRDTAQFPRPNASDQLSDRLRQAVEAGRMTQEQADALARQAQEGGFGPASGSGGLSQSGPFGQQGPFSRETGPGASLGSRVQLRQGLSVTVSLVTASKTNVLMVPNRAIVRSQGNTFVNVQKVGAAERIAVTTGISNSQHTEVTGGLTEGDKVLIQVTTSTASSSQQRGGAFFPGGGMLR